MIAPLYCPGETLLHRVPAGLKLAGLALLGTLVFLTADLRLLAPAALGAGLLLAALRPPRARLRRQLAGSAVLITAVALIAALAVGRHQAAVVMLRLAALVLAALAVTLSTRTSDMMAAVERALAPLDRRGLINAAAVALAVSLVLRFVPVILGTYRDIREAQAARGLTASPLALIVPLVVRALKDADDIAAAIEARGFPPPKP